MSVNNPFISSIIAYLLPCITMPPVWRLIMQKSPWAQTPIKKTAWVMGTKTANIKDCFNRHTSIFLGFLYGPTRTLCDFCCNSIIRQLWATHSRMLADYYRSHSVWRSRSWHWNDTTLATNRDSPPIIDWPGYLQKYAFLYFNPSESFQKCVGILGNGLRQTSSALSLYTALPAWWEI